VPSGSLKTFQTYVAAGALIGHVGREVAMAARSIAVSAIKGWKSQMIEDLEVCPASRLIAVSIAATFALAAHQKWSALRT
jgi:hypothetical protein